MSHALFSLYHLATLISHHPFPPNILTETKQTPSDPHFSPSQNATIRHHPRRRDRLKPSLTATETLWFNYSVNKSDYNLYLHNILFLFIIFTTVPLFYILIDLLFRDYVTGFKIQPKVRFSVYENFKCYFEVMRMFILVVGPLQFVSYPSVQMIGIRTSLPLPSLMEIISQLIVYFLIEDYTNYWIHRFFHCKWGYEKIHKVHHEYTAPIGFAAPYAHWVEVLVLGIPSFLGPAIVPGHMITFWLWIALRQIEAIETHSGYDFPWTITKYIPFYGGADYHDYHHYVGGQSQSNFASVFTYCDYIYGTDKGYRYQKKLLQQLKDGSKSNGGSYGSASDIKSE